MKTQCVELVQFLSLISFWSISFSWRSLSKPPQDPRRGEFAWNLKENKEQRDRYMDLHHHKAQFLNDSTLMRSYRRQLLFVSNEQFFRVSHLNVSTLMRSYRWQLLLVSNVFCLCRLFRFWSVNDSTLMLSYRQWLSSAAALFFKVSQPQQIYGYCVLVAMAVCFYSLLQDFLLRQLYAHTILQAAGYLLIR